LGNQAVSLSVVRHWSTLGVAPPGRNASKYEGLRYIRSLTVRSWILLPIPLALFVIFDPPLVVWAVVGAAFLFEALNVGLITWRMRRAQRSG
jgi:hypothetical protein